MKRDDFSRDVRDFGIKEEDIDCLLQFLHCRVGQIRYFSSVQKLRHLVVREPRFLYNLVTCILTQSFVSRSITIDEHSEIEKGIYSFSFFRTAKLLSHSEFINPEELIHLLKELRIVAPFYDRKEEVEKYFIPCVLNHLHLPPPADNASVIPSLVVSFDQGHCPKGLFGVLLHTILTDTEKRVDWNLDISKVFKDQVSFEVGPYEDIVTMKFCTTYLEVLLHPAHTSHRGGIFSVKNICNIVRSTLLSGIEGAIESLHYDKAKTRHNLGLMCSMCGVGHEIVEVEGQRMVKCSQRYQPIPYCGCCWFGGRSTK